MEMSDQNQIHHRQRSVTLYKVKLECKHTPIFISECVPSLNERIFCVRCWEYRFVIWRPNLKSKDLL